MRPLFSRSALAISLLALLLAGCGASHDTAEDSTGFESSQGAGELPSTPPVSPTVESTSPAPPPEPPPPPRSVEVDPPPPEQPRGSVPPELVGEWDGDNAGAARAKKIAFTADGNVILKYPGGRELTGPAVVTGTSMTLYVPGGPIEYQQWSIDAFDAGYGYTFQNLLLDGFSYVRQISGG